MNTMNFFTADFGRFHFFFFVYRSHNKKIERKNFLHRHPHRSYQNGKSVKQKSG